jgi:hypothetical protein
MVAAAVLLVVETAEAAAVEAAVLQAAVAAVKVLIVTMAAVEEAVELPDTTAVKLVLLISQPIVVMVA